MKTKKLLLIFVCICILCCMIPANYVFADVMSSLDVALEPSTVWLNSDFSTLDNGWVLSNGMYHSGEDEVIRIEEATGTGNDLAEANYSLAGLDFGNRWNIRFRMKLEEAHQGRVDFHFIYGGYRTYCVVTPEENRFALQGNGSRTDRETKKGIWYEYLFQYYIEDGVTKVQIWRRPEGDDSWLDIFTDYPFSDTNLYTGPPALRFFGGLAGDSKKISIDDVRVYSGTYAELQEPLIQGTDVTVDGVIDLSDYGMDKQRQVTLLAASYDKKYGYTKEVQSKTFLVEPGYETEVNHTFHFSSLDSSTDTVKAMMWDSIESGIPLSLATGSKQEEVSNDIPDLDQEIGITPKVWYNQVELNGFLGSKNEKFTASLIKDGVVYAMTQGTSGSGGMISSKLAVNPTCESGTYTLRVQYGNALATDTPVTLQCSDSMVESHGSLEEIVGSNISSHLSIDFKSKNASTLFLDNEDGYYSSGSRYYNCNTGMYLNSTSKETYWRYAPVPNWFVLGDKRSVVFRAKMSDETNPLELRIFEPNKGYAPHQFVLTSNGISTECPSKMVATEFMPGTEWVDYLVIKTGTGIKVYASQESVLSGRWVLVLETTGTASNLASSMGGIHFVGTGYISFLNIYNNRTEQVDSPESLLGGAVASKYDFSMDESFLKIADISQSGTSYEAEGLTLTAGTWRFLPSDSWYALGKNNAIFLRTKFDNLTDTLNVRLSGENGTAKIQLSATGLTAQTGIGTARKLASFSGTEWVDYLILQNALGGYSVYATNDNLSKWYKVAETEDYPSVADGSVGIEITGTGLVQTVKQYDVTGTVTDSGSRPVSAKVPYYQEEFESNQTQPRNVEILSGEMDGGTLILNGAQNDGSYIVRNGGIPIGGYAEFRLKAGGLSKFSTTDGTKKIVVAMNSGDYSLETATVHKLTVSDSGNQFKTWRIVRNGNGTFSGYCKADDEDVWYTAFSNQIGIQDVSDSSTVLSVSGGTLICDYFMIYGPTTNNDFILTDGYGTKVLADGEKYQYYDCIRALVPMDESQVQTVLFAEYTRGALSHWERKEVPAGHGFVSVPYAAKNITADMKVFLWDSLPGMKAVGNKQFARHNWSLQGSARDLHGGLSLNLETAGNSTASFQGNIGENFDVEWSMRINSFSESEHAMLYNGKYKFALTFHEDGISYETRSGSEKILCTIGNDVHTYRLIGKSDICYLYLDGMYLATISDMPESSEEPRLEFLAGQ